MTTLSEMAESCTDCGDDLEIGQIGKCDECQDAGEPQKLHYFIAYQWSAEHGSGFACMDISRTHPITDFAEVEGLCKFIAEYKNFQTVVITNWKRYEEG